MKPIVAITQRVAVDDRYGERRDALDQAWTELLEAAGMTVLPLPNSGTAALDLCRSAHVSGLILSGGNDLATLGGDAPERDRTELALLDMMKAEGLPILAVCRGMQLLQQHYGIVLEAVADHVRPRMPIIADGLPIEVNSFHRWGAYTSRQPLVVFATAEDGVVKGVRHATRPIVGIMWHPERGGAFRRSDIELLRQLFLSEPNP